MILVLFSGGIDSMVLANMAAHKNKKFGFVHFTYDHPAKSEEMAAVWKWCLAKKMHVQKLFMHLPLQASQLNAGAGKHWPRIVPGRNSCFVSMAANLAAAHNYEELWIGCTAEDHQYPDCSAEWLANQNKLLSLWGLTLKAPLMQMPRAEILEIAKAHNWQLKAWSCYQPIKGEPCMQCNSCRQGQ